MPNIHYFRTTCTFIINYINVQKLLIDIVKCLHNSDVKKKIHIL